MFQPAGFRMEKHVLFCSAACCYILSCSLPLLFCSAGLDFRVLELPGGVLLKLPAVQGVLDLTQLKDGWRQAVSQVSY